MPSKNSSKRESKYMPHEGYQQRMRQRKRMGLAEALIPWSVKSDIEAAKKAKGQTITLKVTDEQVIKIDPTLYSVS